MAETETAQNLEAGTLPERCSAALTDDAVI